MALFHKNRAIAKNLLASAAVFMLLLSNPMFHSQGYATVAEEGGATPPPQLTNCLTCFIGCGVEVIKCSLTCLYHPICFIGCGIANLKCITTCNGTIMAMADDQISDTILPKTMEMILSTAGIGENYIKGGFEATANIISSTGSTGKDGLRGSLHFLQDYTGETTHIKGRIIGLSPGIHGLSIHSTGSCSSIGAHFSPLNKYHGASWDANHHASDLGNIVAGPDGVADISKEAKTVQLIGFNSVLGQAIVVHAGAALGCGIIVVKPSI